MRERRAALGRVWASLTQPKVPDHSTTVVELGTVHSPAPVGVVPGQTGGVEEDAKGDESADASADGRGGDVVLVRETEHGAHSAGPFTAAKQLVSAAADLVLPPVIVAFGCLCMVFGPIGAFQSE